MMNLLKRESAEAKAFARNKRLLRDMPWLWALRKTWGASSQITVQQVDHVPFLEYWISDSILSPGVCYIHVATDGTERVREVVIEGSGRKNMYDALEHLREKFGTRLEYVQHIATLVGDETRVYRAKRSTSFAQLFERHARSRRD